MNTKHNTRGSTPVDKLAEDLLNLLSKNNHLDLEALKAQFPGKVLRQATELLAEQGKAAVIRHRLTLADGKSNRVEEGTVRQFAPGKFVVQIPSENGEILEVGLSPKIARQVMPSDVLRVFVSEGRFGPDGSPLKVLKRENYRAMMHVVMDDFSGAPALVMDGRNESFAFPLPEGSRLVLGDYAVGSFSETGLLSQRVRLNKVERIGNKADKGIESEAQKFKHPSLCDHQKFQNAKIDCPPSEMVNRRDERSVPFVTIDGVSTKDLDDAIWCEKTTDGFSVKVAIADVSAFVTPGSELDAEAQKQMTTIYLPHQVLPMVPEALSNGLCSLLPNLDRLALVCSMKISESGEMLSHEFYRSTIRSKTRLSYEEADDIFTEKVAAPSELKSSLSAMTAVAKILRERGLAHGRFDVGDDEMGWTLDANGKIEKLTSHRRLWAHKVVEECMLAANKSAAKSLRDVAPAGFFRNHWGMGEAGTQEFIDVAVELGLADKSTTDRIDVLGVLERAEKAGLGGRMKSELLSRMSPAEYSSENEGHFSLAADEYCHFTSPIRRYADLMVHRLVKSKIDGVPVPYTKEGLNDLAAKATKLSGLSSKMESDAKKLLTCEYLASHGGPSLKGAVDSLMSNGMWVKLLVGDGCLSAFCPSKTMSTAGYEWVGESWTNGAEALSEGSVIDMDLNRVNILNRRIEVAPAKPLTPKLNSTRP